MTPLNINSINLNLHLSYYIKNKIYTRPHHIHPPLDHSAFTYNNHRTPKKGLDRIFPKLVENTPTYAVSEIHLCCTPLLFTRRKGVYYSMAVDK